MIYIPESENIYFAKTREYFDEVISSYANGNYRSAIVMLYSIAICDLLFKLQELSDMYNDHIAQEILEEVEKCRNPDDNKSKSKWEKELVDQIYKKTELLDLESYTNLNHLYDHRNFSAHPAMNENYELISPSKEATIAHIKNVLESILVKPPIFIKKVVGMLSDDLAEKKTIYQDEPNKLKEYLGRKYFDRMSDAMKKSTFKAFWKFCFCLPDDENCMRNISINRKTLELLFDETPGIIDYIKSNAFFENTSPNETCVKQLCILAAQKPQIYQVLSDDSKLQMSSIIEKDSTMRAISWFTAVNKSTHIDQMITGLYYDKLPEETIKFVYDRYEQEGLQSKCIAYFIEYFGHSPSFDSANERYYNAIKPYLKMMSRDQIIRLIHFINENDQIHNRNANYSTNTEIIINAKEVLGSDFDYSKYPYFKFDNDRAFGEADGKTESELDNDFPF